MENISDNLCVDKSQVFGAGASNGAMMLHYLTGRYPKIFTAIYPVYGLPLRGFSNVIDENANTPIIQLHGDRDVTIPH